MVISFKLLGNKQYLIRRLFIMKGKSKSFCLGALLIIGLIVCFTSAAFAGVLNGAPMSSPDKASVTNRSLIAALNTGYSLVYDISGCTCSETGFSCVATATYNLPTDVNAYNYTTLNGEFDYSYSFDLSAGSGTYPTGFGETFSPALPSATYEYSYIFRLVNTTGEMVANSVATIRCNNGVPSASSQTTDTSAGQVWYLFCPPGACPESHCLIFVPGMAGCVSVGQTTYCECTPPCLPSSCSVFVPEDPGL
jgi:hypothetical protein